MSDFMIDKDIKEVFEDYKRICDFLSEYKSTKFFDPAPIEDIEKWEKENDVKLPLQYKSWLTLSSKSSIADMLIEFTWPIIGSFDNEDDVIIIGSLIGDGEDVYLWRETGEIFTAFDDEVTDYEDFDDFLSSVYCELENYASEFYGSEWLDIFNSKYDNN